MIDCSKTENYFKEKVRMTKKKNGSTCGISCTDCPLYSFRNGKICSCSTLQHLHPTEAIAIVQKWSDEHPQKTYKDDFYEKFPNCEKKHGRPSLCVKVAYGHLLKCSTSCDDCWNKVMEVTE